MASDRENDLSEILDRTRRIETRLTKLIESQGIDSGTKKPRWDGETIHLASLEISLKELITLVPASHRHGAEVQVERKGKLVCCIFVGG